MKRRKLLILLGLSLALAFLLAACQSATQTPVPCPTCQPPAPVPTQVPCPTAAPCPTAKEAPFEKLWAASGHADAKAEAFVHWNTADPKVVPGTCATCHSSTGYQEFLATGKPPKAQPVGTVVECATCHNDAAIRLTSVTFPSGAVLNDLGPEARCMVCHQGLASKKQVDDQITKFNVTDVDKVVEPIKSGETTSNFSFINAHYFTAALTLYGTEVKGGYEYAGKTYDSKNQHVPEFDTCSTCHNPHSTEVQVEQCAECHTDVKTAADLRKIRMVSSVLDFNGNGDVKEGIAAEVAGVQDALQKAIYAYAKEVAGLGIVYDGATYPYFLQDQDGDGKADKNDKGGAVAYSKFTARLLKAAYNYQIVAKDPGIFAHNPKYGIQLMYDSIADLNAKLTTKIDMSKMHRDDVGHFMGSSEAFRHWDAEGEVPAGCAKCHSATGLPEFIANAGTQIVTKAGVQTTGVVAQPTANGLLCTSCHNGDKFPELLAVTSVPFPSGTSLTFSTKKDDKGVLQPVAANLCLECHQGRESTVTMNNALAAFTDLDKVDAAVRFRNVHYFAAGATLFGTEAKGIYEYAGKTYVGRFMHVDGFTTCTDCHDAHKLEVKAQACAGCHKVTNPEEIRMTKENYDGSTDANEPMKKVVETFTARLFTALQKYAKEKAGTGILYDPVAYPYFFQDKDNDGKVDKNDKGANVAFASFTPRLVKAAYNYQYAVKDPGAYAHNARYVLQALYDSIEDLGGDLTGLVRPK